MHQGQGASVIHQFDAVWRSANLDFSRSQTGLYSDIASGTFAADVRPFEPKYVLWSDGATKRRFIRLPACAQIDTTDMVRGR